MLLTAFNEDHVLESISEMQAHQQTAIAAACCERMLPSYEMFKQEAAWGDVRPLRQAVDAAWSACEGEHVKEAELREMLVQCEQSAPDSENFVSLYTSPAQDASFAICNLLEFLLDGDIYHVVSALRFSIDSVDLIVQERENMDPRDSLRDEKILEHPLMQQDLARQQRDVACIVNIVEDDRASLRAVRIRASGESILMLP